jgi:hypothetical protein
MVTIFGTPASALAPMRRARPRPGMPIALSSIVTLRTCEPSGCPSNFPIHIVAPSSARRRCRAVKPTPFPQLLTHTIALCSRKIRVSLAHNSGPLMTARGDARFARNIFRSVAHLLHMTGLSETING